MSEEEKKAIESLRKNRGVSFAQADIISNLIDKQLKENKDLKVKAYEISLLVEEIHYILEKMLKTTLETIEDKEK